MNDEHYRILECIALPRAPREVYVHSAPFVAQSEWVYEIVYTKSYKVPTALTRASTSSG